MSSCLSSSVGSKITNGCMVPPQLHQERCRIFFSSCSHTSRKIGIIIPDDSELMVARNLLERTLPIADHNDYKEILAEIYEQRLAFPNVYKMLADVSTIGNSTATCESSFLLKQELTLLRDVPWHKSEKRIWFSWDLKRSELIHWIWMNF